MATYSVVCSNVGSFTYGNRFTLYVELINRDGNSATNKSVIDYNVYFQNTSGGGTFTSQTRLYFRLNGVVIRDETLSVTGPRNGTVTIASGTMTDVPHNPDGNQTVTFQALVQSNSFGIFGNIENSFGLNKIPRYTSITSFSVSNLSGEDGLTKVKYNWATSDAVDYAWYSIDNGNSWYDLPSTDIVSGLYPGTAYNFKLRVRRTDSQLTTDSGTITFATVARASVTEPTAGFSLNSNSSLTVKCTSPSGASLAYFFDLPNGTRKYVYGPTTELSHTWSSEEIFNLLQYVTTSTSSSIKIGVATIVGGKETYYSERAGTYYVVDSNPTFSNFTYKDVDENIVDNLTGDDQTIVKGYSDVQGIVIVANKATAINYAKMSKYRLSIGEKTEDVDYSDTEDVSTTIYNVNSNKFTMYAIDSRENSTPKEITAKKYIEYQDIAIKGINVVRTGNVQAETTLKFTGIIWNGNFGIRENSIVNSYYKYRNVTSNEWSEAIEIEPTQSGSDFTFDAIIAGDLGAEGFDIDSTFEIQVFVADELSNNELNPASFILGPGTPAIAIYKNSVAIGQRYDTDKKDIKLQINGKAQAHNIAEAGTLILDTYDDVGEGQKLQRTGLYTVQKEETQVWYNLINLRHRNGMEDGNNYGLQIRQPFDGTHSLDIRIQHAGTWTEWQQIHKSRVLFDNTSGETGTVTLNDSAANYIYMDIYFRRGSNAEVNMTRFCDPNNKLVSLINSFYWTERALLQVEAKGVLVSENTITPQTDGYINIEGTSITSNGNVINNATASIQIIKVVGYR